MARSNRTRLAGVAAISIAGFVAVALLAGPAFAAGRSVAIGDASFSPATITIRAGDTITWTNRSDLPHNVIFASFGSKMYMEAGERYSHTFRSAGTFKYQCTLHSFTGKVIVTRAASPKPTPKPTKKPTPEPAAPATASPSPTPTPTPSPTPTPAPGQTASPAPPPSVVGPATPAADTSGPLIAILVALVVAGLVGVGAFVVRRR